MKFIRALAMNESRRPSYRHEPLSSMRDIYYHSRKTKSGEFILGEIVLRRIIVPR